MTSLLRIRLAGCLAVAVCMSIAFSGCAVGSKSMSIDSTSKMPWFGLELKERKKKADGPAYRAVNLDKTAKTRLEALGLDDGKASAGNQAPKKIDMALPLTDPHLVDGTKVADNSTDFDFR